MNCGFICSYLSAIWSIGVYPSTTKSCKNWIASLLFGFANGLVVFLGSPAIGINISEHLLSMIPYLITLFVLIFFVGQANGPAANGEIYEKGER